MRTKGGGSARSTFGVLVWVWARRTGPRAGPTVTVMTADPTVAGGTDTQGVIRTPVTRSEWIRWALRPAGDCVSAAAVCSTIATWTLTGAVTRTE